MATLEVQVLEDEKEVSQKLCALVADCAKDAIATRGVFTIGLSGGSLAKVLCGGLPSITTDWSKWRVFFCDERHVPFDNPECTYSVYQAGLFSRVGLQPDHVFPINPDLSVEGAAEDYEKKVRGVFPGAELPRFDLLLLGLGPDGHTCSLFPGHALLQEEKKIIAPISDSPKPPPCRVTMTFPVLNNAACVVFALFGAGKAGIVQQVMEGGGTEEPLPARHVAPTSGRLLWLLDKAAASSTSNFPAKF